MCHVAIARTSEVSCCLRRRSSSEPTKTQLIQDHKWKTWTTMLRLRWTTCFLATTYPYPIDHQQLEAELLDIQLMVMSSSRLGTTLPRTLGCLRSRGCQVPNISRLHARRIATGSHAKSRSNGIPMPILGLGFGVAAIAASLLNSMVGHLSHYRYST